MDLINRLFREIAPKHAVKRIQNQAAFDILEKGVRKYEGAGKGRRFSDNNPQLLSPNTDANDALPMLRKRSREANKNNPYAKNGTRRIANNVIGTGILANPIGKTKSVTKIAKKLWEDWANSTLCDFNGLQNLYGLQLIITKTVIKSGECYVRKVWKERESNFVGIPLELQILDPDFIDHNKNIKADTSGVYSVSGIQFNKLGKRIGYWVFSRHPNEEKSESIVVPASEIAHIFEVDDPGQIHGIPHNSSIILRMQDFDEFEDAQLMKQKIAACFTAFITKPDTSDGIDTSDTSGIERLSPGVIERLSSGEEIIFSSPPSTDGFKDFSRQSLQGQAVGMGLSYESFSGDLSNVNFSSGRMGWLEFQRGVEILQWNMVIPMFLDKTWLWFVEAANLSGLLGTLEVTATWTPPRREMIDPLKEIQAKIKALRAGLGSWQDAVRELGYNPDEIMVQMIEDKNRFDAAGVMPESDPRYDADKMMKVIEPQKEE